MMKTNSKVLKSLFLFTVAFGLISCQKDVESKPNNPKQAVQQSTGVNKMTDATFTKSSNGLMYKDEETGSGAIAEAGKKVSVHYTGTFESGEKFDSSLDRGQPFDFKLGAGQVIKGWDEGVAGMKVGGKRILVIPPDLAYGKNGIPGAIPPNSTLKFEVQLLGVN
ncbi:MAG: FKBP-type peptidyl-prolyl cis-trans isomerase [Candidatus Caenarcaniphilales bacterium]|nr:FKBP-type peptidyl-prolyl cis-trans isomerase [Candidatus Caenarcaniphilales bacterium]